MTGETNRYSFVIVTQNWDSKSNGIKVLYKLSEYIEKCGYKCFLYIWNCSENNQGIPNKYKKKIIDKIDYSDDSLIVILPDALPYSISKEIKSKNRVWYLLNKPMVLTKEPIFIQPNDIFISYSNLVNDWMHQAYYNLEVDGIDGIIQKNMMGEVVKKNQIAVYSGKARKLSYFRLLALACILKSRIVPITRSIPASKDKLFEIISESKLLITFDPLTNLIYESTLCKTPVYIADNYTNTNYKKYNIPLYGVVTKKKYLFLYFRKGIPKRLYNKIVNIYKNSISCHEYETQKMISYILENLEYSIKNDVKEINTKKIEATFVSEYSFLQNQNKLMNHFLTNKTPIYSFKFLKQLFLLFILRKNVNYFFVILCINQKLRNQIFTSIDNYRQVIIDDYVRDLI
jgi:hypothetical protein